MTPLGRRQGELLAQLRDLLILPSSTSSPTANKLVSAVDDGPLAGAAGPGPGPPPPPPAAAPSTMATGGRRRTRQGRSSKRGRDDEVTNYVEHRREAQAEADPAAGAARPRRDYSCKRSRRKKKQQSGGTSSMLVTSAPDLFDGYQWRKYGQKQIEGAMYPRSYYRCTRSAEQGCAAKRTVQRNDDDVGAAAAAVAAAAAAPNYTVVRVGEHTCTDNDSPEAPVILETTAVVPASCCTSSNNSTAPTPSSAAAVATCSTTTAAAATESPATSDTTLSLSSSIASSDYCCYADNDCHHGLLAAVHDNEWVPALAASSPSSSFPTIEDFAGPIRSPVHISPADGWTWTIDQLLLQLVDEPTICQQHL